MYIHTCIPSIIMNQSQKHYGEKRKLQISAVSENLILIKITRQYLCFVGTDRLQCCNTYQVRACAGLWRGGGKALRLTGKETISNLSVTLLLRRNVGRKNNRMLTFVFLKLLLIAVSLIYSVVPISAVQKNDSVIRI